MNILQFIQSLVQNKMGKQEMISPLSDSTPKPVPTPVSTPTPTMNNGQHYGRNPQTTSAPSPITSAIEQASQKYQVPQALLYDIEMAENSLKTGGKNPDSSASGAFQFNDETWKTVLNYLNKKGSSLELPNTDKNDPVTQALAAAYLIKFGQLGRWNASKNDSNNANSWGKYWGDEELNKSGYYAQTK